MRFAFFWPTITPSCAAACGFLLESQPDFTVVAEAADGREAVQQAEATHPDVAVLDIAMPNLSGIEAAQRIAAPIAPHRDRDSEHAFGRRLCACVR